MKPVANETDLLKLKSPGWPKIRGPVSLPRKKNWRFAKNPAPKIVAHFRLIQKKLSCYFGPLFWEKSCRNSTTTFPQLTFFQLGRILQKQIFGWQNVSKMKNLGSWLSNLVVRRFLPRLVSFKIPN